MFVVFCFLQALQDVDFDAIDEKVLMAMKDFLAKQSKIYQQLELNHKNIVETGDNIGTLQAICQSGLILHSDWRKYNECFKNIDDGKKNNLKIQH